MSRPRLLGASLEPLVDLHETQTRSSQLFVELGRSFPIAGFIRPVLTGTADWTVKLLAFHPRREAWRGRAALSPRAFRRRSKLAERQLARRDGLYDLVLQVQTLFAPGRRPYVIYTDNTYSLTRRLYPAWAPLSKRADREWLELERTTFCEARAVFGKSRWVCEAIVDDYGCDPARVHPVGGGANSLAATLEGKTHARRIALFVGNKYELKGVPTLLEAWAIVRERLPEALLWIAGLDAPGDARGQLPSVHWLGYVSDRRGLDALYRDASVFVLPSQFEAWGNAVAEAMGCGLPCVVTDVGGLPELVEDGKTGVLVPPRDADALAAALIALLSDPARAAKLGRAGYEKARTQLTWRAVADRMSPHLEAAADG
ncbi:MAG TPA: glycosyltransferase family 4 protein [Gaiellaceae bacterium]|nr:glycosyltransferase family 4 protein [Gaiellaceae bacterium]